MGHIEKRGTARWRARYRAPGGREISRTFDRKADAERFLTSVEHSKLTGGYVDPSDGRVTFEAFAERWRSVQVHRPLTEVSAEHQLRLHVYPHIGVRPLVSIRPTDIQALVHRMSMDLAPSTVAVVYSRVVAVFRAAVRDRMITSSPCVDIRTPPKAPSSTLEVLTTDQVQALAAAVSPRYRAVIIALAGTGLRPGELFGLSVDRIDFLRRTIRVDQQIVRVPGRTVEPAPLKTPASYRTLPLPTVVSEAVAAHLSEWPAHLELGLVFTNQRGGPIQQHPFASVWHTAKQHAGTPDWATPHDLRHYYASLLIRSGASVKVIQARLGHASAKTTLDVYGHLFPDEEDRTRAAVDLELGEPSDDRVDRIANE